MKGTLLYVTSILGAGLKLGPVAVIDEIGLIIYFLMNITKQKWPIRVDVYTFTLLWFLMLGFVAVYYENINVLRYIFIPALLLLYDGRSDHINFKYIILSAIVFLLLNLAFPVCGWLLHLDVAWWQSWLWTGTAYSAICIYLSGALVIAVTKSDFFAIFVLLLIVLVAALADSRFTMLLSILLFIGFFLRKKNAVSKFWNVKKCLMIVVLVVMATILYKNNSNINGIARSTAITIKDVIGLSDEKNRDNDRKSHINAVFQLFERDKWHFLVGHGTLSHQYGLADYLPKSSDGRVRPTGLPAIIFDGGLLLFILIVSSGMWSIFNIIKQAIRIKVPLHVLFLCLTFPFVALLSIPITNTMEMVLWWLALSPRGLAYIVLRECQYSMYNHLGRLK